MMKQARFLVPGWMALAGLAGCSVDAGEVKTKGQALSVDGVSATLSIQNDWGAGYCADVQIANSSAATVSDWVVTLDLGDNSVGNLWNGSLAGDTVTPVAHNSSIASGTATNFGFCASGSERPSVAALSFDGGGGAVTATCDDGVQNQGETGVDCGGPCAACAPSATCDDGVQNQGETGVDCGGPCSACAPTATCSDGIQNQGETGVDCGGPCSACAPTGGDCTDALAWVSNDWRVQYAAGDYASYQGQFYRAEVDIDYPNGQCAPDAPEVWCAHWFTPVSSCEGGGGTPTATCSDGIQNQGETGVDCGGPCSACAPTATCSDGIQNQGETGVDCGGPCRPCAPTATCSDGIQNQGETGVDCGGPCSACAPTATCSDGIQNQGETGVDCGGPCGPCDDGGSPSCDGYATRYWDCCMAHCSWEGNLPMSVEPLGVCSADDQPLSDPSGSSCSGGNGYMCHDYAPYAVSSTLSYGYAATSSNDVCGRCYEIEFTGQGQYGDNQGAANLAGKRMIVQATNIGYDVGGGQFDLLIPGGGVGLFDACSSQWGVSSSELGATYGGFLTACQQQGGGYDQIKSCVRDRCDSVFGTRGLTELQEGCHWFVDWFEAADNPKLKYREVACPAELTGESGMDRSALGDIDLSCTQ